MSGFQTVEENSIKRSIKSILETVQFEVFEVQSLNFRNFETLFWNSELFVVLPVEIFWARKIFGWKGVENSTGNTSYLTFEYDI